MPNQKRHIAFIYTEESIGNLEPVSEHSPDVVIQSSSLDDFLQNPDTLTRNVDHIVVSVPMAGLKSVIRIFRMQAGDDLAQPPRNFGNNLCKRTGSVFDDTLQHSKSGGTTERRTPADHLI